MEGLLVALFVLFLIWLLIAPIVALVVARNAKARAENAEHALEKTKSRVEWLESELRQLKEGNPSQAARTPTKIPAKRETPEITPGPVKSTPLGAILERASNEARKADELRKSMAPPPLPEPVVRKKLVDWDGASSPPAAPPPLPEEPQEPFSLEKFMGVKLFAWLGGVAMFFGVIFFVKYAFENNLISPATRITLGFVTGTGLLAGGLVIHRLPKYKVLAQAFCATGVLILYGVSFAAHAVYHFPAFGSIQTFVLMAGITFAAFFIAVRLNALVVAVLGMLGGFMTPVLLSTGQDQVLGLFGYIALLDIGLLAVSRHGRWRFLTPCAATGTAVMQIGWFFKFFGPGNYDEGSLTLIPMGILLGFIVLFLAGGWIKRRRLSVYAAGSVVGLAAVAVAFAFVMLSYESVARRYFLLHGFLLLVHLGIIATVIARPRLGMAQVVAALLGFLHLALWTVWYLSVGNLHGTLALYLVFGALHAVAPVILSRRMATEGMGAPVKSSPWFPPLALAIMVLPVLQLDPVPITVWGGILMANLLVIALAAASRAVLPVLLSLFVTMILAGIWLLHGPASTAPLMPFLGVVSGFTLLFSAAGKWLFRDGLPEGGSDQLAAKLLPAASAVLPFGLLLCAIDSLPIPDPSPVFAVSLLMTVLLAALAIFGKQGKLLLIGLSGTAAVEGFWFVHHFDRGHPQVSLIWFIGFYLLFLVLPFVFRKRCVDLPESWIASALSGVAHFLLIHPLIKQAFPNDVMGMVPAAFAVPSIFGLWALLKFFPEMDKRQRSRAAWFGGVALLFITLIFPIQFERQWITVSWAIEGALLIWLYRRVPHQGLLFTGLGLLVTTFVRLALNPAVFTSYERSGTPILNWHIYAFGIVAAAQFIGARWFRDPENRLEAFKPVAGLYTMGGVLLFLLLNIEIADFFTAPGSRYVAFEFGGNFARDMTYSIAWGLFSLALLGIGFRSGSKHARFTAIALLVLTLVKVFLHDLAAIQNIFRIGALVGVAIIAFIASFLYQRFFDKSGQGPPPLT
ncbi:MAG: DUF2339 domain-containing protein [Verrucomicrobiaceae bacterium]|nr:MAG: DUF2339 domain-containing protein [Verrucomicrobiaceae bacterium]